MLWPAEHIGTLRLWPATTRGVRTVVVRLIIAFVLMLLIGALSCSVALARKALVSGQARTFTTDSIEYALDLPSPEWQVISRLDVHDHFEFIFGDDAANGYLRLRKIQVQADTAAIDIFRREEKWELQRLPGYVVCGECEGESFDGALAGVVFAYEYVSGGLPMHGRIYYLQVDKRTFYSLRFTVACDKLPAVRDQLDIIARSFRFK